MKKLIFFSIALMNCLGLCAQKVLVNGVSWYDDRDSIVSAHAGSVIHNEDSNTFYLFGEYKTDSANVFNGFSCYSSTDFVNWKWEGLALPPQRFGRMSRTMIGERPKVIRCAATGEYIMLMHSDNRSYTDPAVLYATSKTLVGPYTLQGPLLFEEKPIKQGGIAAFVDDDGKGYLIDNKGEIYRLSSDFHYAEDKICQSIAGMGVGPSIIHQNGLYYLFCSNNTGWDSNDNFYYTAADLTGPWTPRGIFARKGTNTWDSQVGNVFMLRY
nr:glycosyl hydrolase family 43 [Prevotella sp.]